SAVHTLLSPQLFPQAPQCRRLESIPWVFTHCPPPQSLNSGPQAATQLPAWHRGVAPEQVTPQPPQCFGSLVWSTQSPPQDSRPSAQAAAQDPRLQCGVLPPQTLPQAPQ